jgi:DNA-directed RNA polymerase subunit RPC12/RpoP
VFKIAGVRALIKKYKPSESFDRTEAIKLIGNLDPVTHQPRFDAYKSLFIETRDTPELKPEDAFLFLLKKGVFRAGLKFACPTCQLDFWSALDEARSEIRCPYCGFEFNVLPQLRDRNWAYRRSGLFGREDNQHGGIPVAVTLMQLETMLHGRLLAYAPGIELASVSAPVEHCEADLVMLTSAFPHSDEPIELVLAECKDQGGEITDEDIRKLRKVADALRDSPCSVYLLFAKCGQFTDAEIECCRAGRRRLFEHDGEIHYAFDIIMLSERELEPYYIYERAAEEFEIQQYAHSFEELAINTVNIYLEPKRKPVPPVPGTNSTRA